MDKLKSATSKLSNLDKINLISSQGIGLINKRKNISTIKTFRLSNDDLKILEKIREEINKESRTNITDNKIIKALIYLGDKVGSEELLKAMKDMI